MEGKQEALHVNDVVSTNMFALRSKNAVGEVFNVASGTAISVYKLAKKLQKITNTKHLMLIFTEPRAGNIKHCSADIEIHVVTPMRKSFCKEKVSTPDFDFSKYFGSNVRVQSAPKFTV